MKTSQKRFVSLIILFLQCANEIKKRVWYVNYIYSCTLFTIQKTNFLGEAAVTYARNDKKDSPLGSQWPHCRAIPDLVDEIWAIFLPLLLSFFLSSLSFFTLFFGSSYTLRRRRVLIGNFILVSHSWFQGRFRASQRDDNPSSSVCILKARHVPIYPRPLPRLNWLISSSVPLFLVVRKIKM